MWIDFEVYRWGVRTWLDGGSITGGGTTTSVGIYLPWVYPPFAVLALIPFAVPPFPIGAVLLQLCGLAALGLTLFLVLREVRPAWSLLGRTAAALLLSALALHLEPIAASFGLGQINIVLMGLVAVDLFVRRPRWPRGLLLGIAIGIKLTPAAFLVLLIVHRRWRTAAVAVATAASTVAVGFVVAYRDSIVYWFTQGPATGVAGSAYKTNQAIRGGLARLDLGPAVTAGVWAAIALVLIVAFVRAARRADPTVAVVSAGLLALLISPTSWSDHWVWVAPGLLLMVARARDQASLAWLGAAAMTAAVAVLAPFADLPGGAERELSWTAWQHIAGNSYLLTGVLLLLVFVVRPPQRVPVSKAIRTDALSRTHALGQARCGRGRPGSN